MEFKFKKIFLENLIFAIKNNLSLTQVHQLLSRQTRHISHFPFKSNNQQERWGKMCCGKGIKFYNFQKCIHVITADEKRIRDPNMIVQCIYKEHNRLNLREHRFGQCPDGKYIFTKNVKEKK